MLVWVPSTFGAIVVGHVLCPRLSGGEKGPVSLAAEWVASRGLAWMAAEWVKHLYGLFRVTEKEASRSGQRLSLVCCFLFPPSLFLPCQSSWVRVREDPGLKN